MLGTDVVDIDVMEVDMVSRIISQHGIHSHISSCIERGELGMKRSLFMCDDKIVGAGTWVTENIPLGWLGGGRVQELIEGSEIIVFRAAESWVFCSSNGICGDSDPTAKPWSMLVKGGMRKDFIDDLCRNRCYAFVIQIPGHVSSNGVVFSTPHCYCVAVWSWVGKNHFSALSIQDWDVTGCAIPRTFNVEEGVLHCRRLTPDSCVGIVGIVDKKFIRYMNADMLRLALIRDASTKRLALCFQKAGVHSLSGHGLASTCRILASSGVEPRYIQMYNACVQDLWKAYMREKVWKTCSYTPMGILRSGVDHLHKEYIKRIGLANASTNIYRVQLYFASRCPSSLANDIMQWRERVPRATML